MFIAFAGKGCKALEKFKIFILPFTAALLLYMASAEKNDWNGVETPREATSATCSTGSAASPRGSAFGFTALPRESALGSEASTRESALGLAAPLLEPTPGSDNPTRESASAPILTRLIPHYRKNSDLAGWLYIEGTGIDHPVMYTPDDEDYYIDKNFSKKPDKYGTLFIQASCDPFKPCVNIIIHGHNMKKGGKMFSPLIKYKDEAYFRKHPEICYDTLTEEGKYDIISVFLSQVYLKSDNVFKYYKFVNADTYDEFESFTSAIKELSLYETGVEAEFGDTFITLSTCEYSRENGRMVVVARKIRNK